MYHPRVKQPAFNTTDSSDTSAEALQISVKVSLRDKLAKSDPPGAAAIRFLDSNRESKVLVSLAFGAMLHGVIASRTAESNSVPLDFGSCGCGNDAPAIRVRIAHNVLDFAFSDASKEATSRLEVDAWVSVLPPVHERQLLKEKWIAVIDAASELWTVRRFATWRSLEAGLEKWASAIVDLGTATHLSESLESPDVRMAATASLMAHGMHRIVCNWRQDTNAGHLFIPLEVLAQHRLRDYQITGSPTLDSGAATIFHEVLRRADLLLKSAEPGLKLLDDRILRAITLYVSGWRLMALGQFAGESRADQAPDRRDWYRDAVRLAISRPGTIVS